jgi:hypothetical protein
MGHIQRRVRKGKVTYRVRYRDPNAANAARSLRARAMPSSTSRTSRDGYSPAPGSTQALPAPVR